MSVSSVIPLHLGLPLFGGVAECCSTLAWVGNHATRGFLEWVVEVLKFRLFSGVGIKLIWFYPSGEILSHSYPI
ncbi:hypothetical protein CEXT_305261 [Caerostris extrusa]|uniref:Uncharacterized protein n=1 Tax=Caerostris extrusa TaxID=172846 RepID=A0AAV4XEG3_CAEEX|nr:hypothetical protein CEXT_305261 [Caerostris extrusa]